MDAHQPINHPRPRLRGFSITELLVVIGIIVILVGLLIVAMGRVRETSMRTSTISTMQSFARACEAFQTDHGFYPGVIPEHVLAQANAEGQIEVLQASGANVSVGPSSLSGTENALLHLMGGFAVRPPGTPEGSAAAKAYDNFIPAVDFSGGAPGKLEFQIGAAPSVWLLKVDANRIGEGPVINGKPYAPYFTPGPREVAVVQGQVDQTDDTNPQTWHVIPDLNDAWGQPVLYTRRIREHGPLVGPHDASGADRPQFMIEGMAPYFEATHGTAGGVTLGLGERNVDQAAFSILAKASTSPGVDANRYATFAQIIRHPAFGEWGSKSPLSDENRGRVVARGTYILISAGPDGIYFSRHDGPGTPGSPVDDIVTSAAGANNPQAIASYDDIIIFGGG